jgi:epoxyqueuosine reductase
MMSGKYEKSIKEEAKNLGFYHCGIAKAVRLDEDAIRLEKWLNQQYHGEMAYMANHFDKRVDPRLLVEDAKSVITLLFNYFPSETQQQGIPKIAKYAYGKDYHVVIKEKLQSLLAFMQQEIGEVHGRGFVDSAPVLERSWAVRSGAGWIGKNGNLISKQQGSFFFIATLIVDIDLTPDLPFVQDYCGTCTRCVDACPTDAILPNKEIDGSQCISYYTIELKNALIETDKKWDEWIFGCDICQDVCPWNRFSKPHDEIAFTPSEYVMHQSLEDWEEITEDLFKKRFKHSPLLRSKWTGIQRNLSFVYPKKASE